MSKCLCWNFKENTISRSKLLYGKKHDFCTTFSLRCTCWSKLPCITISLSPNVPTKKDLRSKVQRCRNGEQITLWEKSEFYTTFSPSCTCLVNLPWLAIIISPKAPTKTDLTSEGR